MHQHDIKPEEGIPYCEFLAAAKRSLEDRLATLERVEQSRRELLEYLERFETVGEEEAGVIVPAWPM
jgi:hypothetical protein